MKLPLAAHPPRSFEATVVREDDAVRVSFCGELDLASADLAEQTLRRAADTTANRIVIDLSAVEFIDLAGLRVVLDAARRWAGRVSLRRALPAAQRIFAVTATEDRLPFID